MGCDIHTYAERKDGEKFVLVDGLAPFDWRAYGMFGFLADVRNYSAVPPIAARRGFPEDASQEVSDEHDDWSGDAHSASWLTVAELAAFDYDKPMEDRRVTIDGNGGCTAAPGEGSETTYREFLGSQFFDDIEKLKRSGASRVVFWFDN